MTSKKQKNAGWLLPETITGYDLLCVTLKIPDNTEYRAAFAGALHMLDSWWNWEKSYTPGDTRASQAAFYWRDLLDAWLQIAACGGDDLDFRQNPDDSCQFQYSKDGGETWLLAFDFGLCVPPWAQSLISSANTGGTVVINPAAPDDTFTSQPGDTDEERQARVDGLCFASGKVVASMMEAAFKVCDGTATGLNIAGLVLGIITVILVDVEIISFGLLTPLIMAAFAALFEIAAQVKALSCDAYLDTDTRDRMTCLMFQNLMNRGVSLANFRQAFSGFECISGDAGDVAYVLDAMLQSPSQGQALFDNFLNVLASAQSAALQGATLTSCICEQESWATRFDFAADGMGIWDIVPMQDIPGIYEAGCGARALVDSAVLNCDDIGARGVAVRLRFFVPDGTTVTQLRIWYTGSSGDSSTYVDGDCAYFATGLQDYAWRDFSPALGAGQHEVIVEVGTNIDNRPAVHSLGLIGTGVCPFDLGCDDLSEATPSVCV